MQDDHFGDIVVEPREPEPEPVMVPDEPEEPHPEFELDDERVEIEGGPDDEDEFADDEDEFEDDEDEEL